ncbi:O-antigen ligase family protein [Synoicihabitans lomoniglobus]|uniref:O-antigen ligase family protein n=1 Tax=Synoicihabitans lomoniglobus TaxID=2909285 RepID=A0AAE9ZXD3_9BACT|nr:O-antigen ligase family protein [Opitutaceae bacterium LMO-M01]WED65246.1 O-antigen ligase family protein [Opitutaceae bacterium LMO-M01]
MTTLAPVWRTRLFTGTGVLLALVAGYHVAQGSLLWPAAMVAASLAVVASLMRTTRLQAWILASLVAGYVVGNRGFAQLTLLPGLPLLPAEAGLIVLVGLQVIQRATRGAAGYRVGGLEILIVVWMVIGAVRFAFDFPRHGFFAARDFATVYYAAFFFLAQNWVRRAPELKEVLLKTVRISAVVLLFTHRLVELFPGFFFDVLQINGAPLIYYKADLVGMFLAMGAIVQYLRFEQKGGWYRPILAAAMVFEVINTDNRAAMLALVVGGGWLMLGRRWKLTAWVGTAAVLGVLGTLWVARITNTPWQQTPLLGLYEKAISVVDPAGHRRYQGEDTFNKGANNQYRLVWWELVTRETWETNPVLGLGFGHDLASEFMQTYYANVSEDYNVRSPHSIIMTVFARMGLVGLAAYLAIIVVITKRTWHVVHTEDRLALPFWLSGWTILVTACFGVVLEGPMGAVIFWLMLGTANGLSTLPSAETAAPELTAVEPDDASGATKAPATP